MEKTEMHLIQSAHQWRIADKKWKGATAEERPQIESELYKAKRKLRESIDLDAARNEKNKSSLQQSSVPTLQKD